MKDLIKELTELEKISEELEPSESKRFTYLKEVQNYTNEFINTIDESVSFDGSGIESGKLKITSGKKNIKEIIKIYAEQIANKGINAASGGHVGYIPGGGIYTSAISDFLADVTNEYAGMFYGSPGAVTIEHELLNWMKEVFSYPKNAVELQVAPLQI